MDKHMDALFTRLDRALSSLIDSISKYNPSPSLAIELLASDDALSRGLADLEQHQRNHQRIQHLQAVSAQLDTQISSLLTDMAALRKELKATPATHFPDRQPFHIQYAELLDYATRICPTTYPPASFLAKWEAQENERAQAQMQMQTQTQTQTQTQLEGEWQQTTKTEQNGNDTAANTPGPAVNATAVNATAVNATTVSTTAVSTTAVSTTAVSTTAATPNPSGATPAPTSTPASGGITVPIPNKITVATSSLPEATEKTMNPFASQDFVPWPHEDLLRGGALASIAMLAASGIDPEGYDPAAEAARKIAEEEAVKEKEEAERKAREEKERAVREAREEAARQREKEQGEAWRRVNEGQAVQGQVSTSPVAPATGGGKKTQQFHFGMDESDDDE